MRAGETEKRNGSQRNVKAEINGSAMANRKYRLAARENKSANRQWHGESGIRSGMAA